MTVLADRAIVHSAVSTETWHVDTLVAELTGSPTMRPFDERALDVAEHLGRSLLAMRDEPACVTLGYWLRRASLERMRRALDPATPAASLRVPRGTVLHITPANVDTVFVHSWVLAMLAGNRSIVRLSSRTSTLRDRIVGAIAAVLAEADPDLRRANRLVTTGHDDAVMAPLSAAADVRIVWGGDRTVEHIRSLPASPRGKDVIFPDRHSLAIIDADAVLRASDVEMAALGGSFFNDAYWFDQGACSSPRLIIWAAEEGVVDVDAARRRFHAAVGSAIRARGYAAQVGLAITKLATSLERAARGPAHIERDSNEATWVRIGDLGDYDRASCGGGLFFEAVSTDLGADLVRLVGARDQTAGCFGIDADRARSLAVSLNGQGIDRWVPIGRALEFDATWDGYDLLAELTRLVTIDLPRSTHPSRQPHDADSRSSDR